MYDHWKGNFYPDNIPKKEWFPYYAARFDSVELNVTFYRLPKRETFLRWRDITPEDFVFSLKGSRYISHVKRLSDVSEAVDRFFERASGLGEKLGVVLWQFPPRFDIDMKRFEQFLETLHVYTYKNAFEFRNRSWICPEVETVLKESGYCFCMADWPEFLKDPPLTADYIYIRRHGQGGHYDTLYSREQLLNDVKTVKRFHGRGVRDAFIFFNNDYMGYAPRNALTLKDLFVKDV